MRTFLRFEIRCIFCRRCGAVKRERLDFLADNPFYIKRFVYYVGRRCRGSAIKEIAEELLLDWDSVKELDRQYMQAQLAYSMTIYFFHSMVESATRISLSQIARHTPAPFLLMALAAVMAGVVIPIALEKQLIRKSQIARKPVLGLN